MTTELLDAVVRQAGSSFDKKGTAKLPEDTTITLHVAHDGAGLTVARVVSLTVKGEIVSAEDDKGERYVLSSKDVFAATVAAEDRSSARKAGFLR
ncbi:MAG: hypothetical protein JRI23_36505 [Deltaproteobacteria bacterium]|jgi:hypothetical protein|nr:hypothetical protein [Deltaproteobacteria bacterium]MBW2537855.1 hypothetical protein [Deltaproteobacteria bacterium]